MRALPVVTKQTGDRQIRVLVLTWSADQLIPAGHWDHVVDLEIERLRRLAVLASPTGAGENPRPNGWGDRHAARLGPLARTVGPVAQTLDRRVV